MWAESNNYFYRGRLVAKTKGGSLYTAPEIHIIEDPEPNGTPLKFVDVPAMVEKNKDILEKLVQETIKKVYNTYIEYQDKVDIFHVSYSGGKDSEVTFDIVQRALPHNAFVVLFGDTGMEFPDSYDSIENVKKICNETGINFYIAKSDFKPIDSWKKFGAPSSALRWCCGVHKTAPQLLKLREITGKCDLKEMAFVGVRSSESVKRSEYDYISFGTKHSGQFSFNPILEWNSAEVYLYIYSQDLFLHDSQWRYALELFKLKNSWLDIIDDKFGSHKTLEHIISSYDSLTEDDQWLYFIALKLCGSKNNNYLNMVLSKVFRTKEFMQQLCRYILNIDVDDKNYWQLYNERKVILNQISGCKNELCNYCDLVFGKNIDTIYYLTDVTQKECETIFKYLDQYGEKIERKKLIDILSKVYPALYEYMQPYQFKNTLLNEYFQEYKFQKVINKLLPSFVEIVEQQAKKRDYNSILSPRSSVIEKLDKKNSQLYFIDAMGVEYLGFILSECVKMNLDVHITVCRSELPSVTSRNKEFLNAFNDSNYPIISIKDIDDIKHHGKDNYDYYKHSKLPIHLIKELEIIQKVLKKINADLTSQNKLEKVFIISDHGASRLAVLYDNENIWEMSEKGEHSGRCCLKSDVDRQPDYATDADDFWSLANYDRFKGGRKSNVEVHGGATLEEICVPVIELTRRSESAEIYLMPTNSIDIDDTKIPEIEVSFRKKAALKIYSTTPISNIVVNNNSYEVIEIGNKYYSIEMYDIKKAGTYNADIYSGDNKIASKQFIVKKEGQHEKKLL